MFESKDKKTTAKDSEVRKLSNRELNAEAKALMQRAEGVFNQMPEFKNVAGSDFFSRESESVIFMAGGKRYEVFSFNKTIPGGADVLKGLNITEDKKSLSIHLFANTLDIDLTKIPGLGGTLAGSIEYNQPTTSKLRNSSMAVKKVSDYFNRLEDSIKVPTNSASAK